MNDVDLDLIRCREWSSRAAREALSMNEGTAKKRCALSASFWCSIADAIEADDEALVASLMNNLTILPARYRVPSI